MEPSDEEMDSSVMVCFGGDDFTKKEMKSVVKRLQKTCSKLNLKSNPESESTSKVDNPAQKSTLSRQKQSPSTSSKSASDFSVESDTNESTDSGVIMSEYENVDKSRLVALDCECVGVVPNDRSALGRCSVVDYNGKVLCDIYTRPRERIVNYRTKWSGLRPRNLKNAIPFLEAKKKIQDLLQGKIVIGHALSNDFPVLQINHPPCDIRDTSNYPKLKELANLPQGKGLSLKNLTFHLRGECIQNGEHCSVEDSRAAMELYKLVEKEWEQDASDGKYPPKPQLKRKRQASNKGQSKYKRAKGSAGNQVPDYSMDYEDDTQGHLFTNMTRGGVESKRSRTYSRDYFGDEFWQQDFY